MADGERRFDIVGGAAVKAILAEHAATVLDLVQDAYCAHHAGRTINPDSYFLRFPDQPSARIIALPARLQDDADVAGIKWISSFPTNHDLGLARASAVVVLNDMRTGFPYACLEGSVISAARTAASAALGAALLHDGRHAKRLAIIGAGPIAAMVMEFLLATGWGADQVRIHDLEPARAERFGARLAERGLVTAPAASAEEAIDGADLVVFATTAGTPHLFDPALFAANPTVLHISLRDLSPEVILSAQNVADDVEHAMKAQTSLHLAEQQTGGRDFMAGAIAQFVDGDIEPDFSRPRIFSPFGLGVLDLAVARFVHRVAVETGRATAIDGFFPDG